jgi:L-seryl-tRNA(Ser) seleniumtransferase
MRRNPLTRALRPGKQTLAALQATLELYLEGTQSRDIPVLRMMASSVEELRARSEDAAVRLQTRVGEKAVIKVCELTACVGGGAVAGSEIPSVGLELSGLRSSAGALSQRLRSGCPPVIGRTRGEVVLLDLRTVPKEQDAVLIDAVAEAVADNA